MAAARAHGASSEAARAARHTGGRALTVAGDSVPVMDPVVVAGVVGGAFALGGVVLGGAMNWAACRGAERRAAAARRDELYLSVVDVYTRLDLALMDLWLVMSDDHGRLREMSPNRRRRL